MRYIKKITQDPLPRLKEDERIYLNVSYKDKNFAQYSRCGFDQEKKLWFTGSFNSNLCALIDIYGINEETSEKAKQLLKNALSNPHPIAAVNTIIDVDDNEDLRIEVVKDENYYQRMR